MKLGTAVRTPSGDEGLVWAISGLDQTCLIRYTGSPFAVLSPWVPVSALIVLNVGKKDRA